MGASIWQPGGPSVPVADPNSQIKSQQFVATASQTLFPITLFTYVTGADAIEVFRNGLKVPKSGVIETSSASFTLVTPCLAGDVVEVVGNTVVADAGNSAVAAHNSELAAAASASTALTAKNEAVAAKDAAVAAAATVPTTYRGTWVTAITYNRNDSITQAGSSYLCTAQHLSGTFVTDLAAGKWQLLAAKGADGTGTGDMLKANNLSDLTNPTAARSNLGLGTAATQAVEVFAPGAHSHTGTAVSNIPAGNISSTTVQAAINELDTDKQAASPILAGWVAGTTTTSAKNRLINSNFQINQLGVSGTVTLAAGQYGHDGFKAGASGWTYTFSTSGGITTINTTAGNPVQVVNGKYLQSGPMVLGWGGTAQARIDGGTYAASPIVSTAVAGVNQTIEWGLGTLKLTQYEPGVTPSAFEHRDDELTRCQRYFYRSGNKEIMYFGACTAGFNYYTNYKLPEMMNAVPVISNVTAGTLYLFSAPSVSAVSATIVKGAALCGTTSANASYEIGFDASARL